MKVQIFDPAMCCSTGVCGPQVDPDLARFAADLDWLSAQGVAVRRFNLSQEPGAFASSAKVSGLLQNAGDAVLPVVIVGDEVKSTGHYPSRAQLAAWTLQEAAITGPSSVEAGACCGGSDAQSDCC